MKDNILIVAGGTGGHIWPAISFGKWIDLNKPDFCAHYACGSRSLEAEIYKSANIEPNVLQIEGSPFSGRSVSQKIHRFLALFTGFFKARRILKDLNPVYCVLFAGYISFPFILACKFCKIPLALHEQNAYAGKVTRVARKLGIDVYTGWDECKPLPIGSYTSIGVPVRDFETHNNVSAWGKLGFPEDMPSGVKVVVFTGSLGSIPIRKMICDIAIKEKYKNWSFILPSVSDKLEKPHNNVYFLPKIWEASLLFSLADIAVARAGGSTLTEIGTFGIPAIIIPWRRAVDDHQFYNASIYTAENEAVIWDERSDLSDFEKKLFKIYKIYQEPKRENTSKLYNKANKICENLWLALFLKFERSVPSGTRQ